jgi:hypothetical protein
MKIQNLTSKVTGTIRTAWAYASKAANSPAGKWLKEVLLCKHVVNTLGAGGAGALIGYLTILPMQPLFTIGLVLGLYNSLTKK